MTSVTPKPKSNILNKSLSTFIQYITLITPFILHHFPMPFHAISN